MNRFCYTIYFGILPFLFSCASEPVNKVATLKKHNLEETIYGEPGVNQISLSLQENSPAFSYSIYSSDESSEYDPYRWMLKGSSNKKNWTVIDERENQQFCSRFQEKTYTIQKPGDFEYYRIEISAKNDSLRFADIRLHSKDLNKNWKAFDYPEVEFNNEAPLTKGSEFYNSLVQYPGTFIRYHARKVAEILFYTDKDSMNNVQKIQYTLKDYKGISAKSGHPPVISIVYSTQHVEQSAKESMYKLDYETRGVLFHEITHAYQFEPRGIGTYSTNKEFWACIEGLADAVRTQAGFFDIDALRKPGGHWLDGYKTTGFFLHWLTTKDSNAIRKFHLTVRDLPQWSFDKAMKQIFGPDSGIEILWEEYQDFLNNQSNQGL
ncbi:basic secretory protein-like protein [Marinilabilia salmonicolor]|uniref:basic secretory protein-like protein n=1 Tax=Marinilabilia salmonicolor TaxID=989 RepID=UPI00029A643A|nr:basic secretory protein-like protein [Marinilabilia salmonicolor]